MSRARIFGIGAVLIVVVAAVFFVMRRGGPGSQAQSITILSYGGAFEAAQRNAFFDPFEKETGIKVNNASYGGEYGKIKADIQAAQKAGSTAPYDVADVESSALMRGIQDGLWTKLDLTKIRSTDLNPAAIDPYGIATDFYSVSLGWNTKAFPATGPQPQTWADFWDVKRFPGPRALKRDAKFTLEIALLADGVAPDQMYAGGTLDVDRAFRSLDRIKPYVKVWWTSGQQPIQLLSQGDVIMVAAFGARIYAAQHDDRAPVAMTWKNGILDSEYWVIPKGAPSPDAALRFIDIASQAEQQARLPEKLPLGPVNTRAFVLMPPALASNLNTSPATYRTQLLLNSAYWIRNETTLQDRFDRWLAKP